MMTNVALFTFGLMHESIPKYERSDFQARAAVVYFDVAAAHGYVGHAEKQISDMGAALKIGDDFGPWGLYVVPNPPPGLEEMETSRVITTLSLWRDVDSARRFVYGGNHRDALKRRHNWFTRGPWPSHVMWLVDDGILPSWKEGAEKFDALANHGEGPGRFTFKSSTIQMYS